jgi:hypothetical protein
MYEIHIVNHWSNCNCFSINVTPLNSIHYEFETFNYITTPCDMPKITIAEKVGQSFIGK